MKSKITSFIMKILIILVFSILIFLGLIIYEEMTKSNLVDDVQEFISNITFEDSSSGENIIQAKILENVQITENYEKQENHYFFNQLNKDEQIIYKSMENNNDNMKTGIYEIKLGSQLSDVLSKSDGEKLLGEYYQSAIEAYTYDHPEVFYIDFGKMYLNIETTTRGSKKTFQVFINKGNENNYLKDEFSSIEEINSALEEIEKIKAYFIQNKKEDTYKNVKMIHDYLVESIEYDQTISNDNVYNIYGAFINKKCVCEGYAKAFQYLMDALKIPSVIVSGKATNSDGNTENHAWNYVQIGENWYGVDCTWDDPIIIGPGFLSNSSKYKYFLKGREVFNKTHIPEGQFTEGGKIFEFPNLSQ